MKLLLKLCLLLVLPISVFGQGVEASKYRQTPFAKLGTPVKGQVRYVTDGTAGSPCTGGGMGAYAYANGTSWICTTQAPTVATTPGGSNTQVQFNDSSAFGGDAGLVYNKTTDVLTVGSNVIIGATGLVGYGSTSNSAGYTNGTGPIWNDLNTSTAFQLDLSNLTANRSLIVPNASGTLALLASPTFTGTPTLPTGTIAVTQSAGNSTTAVATTAFVTTADNLKANLISPSFTTPSLGVAGGTSLALGGATIGTDTLGVTGTSTFTPANTTGNGVSFNNSVLTTGNTVSITASGTAAASNTKTALSVATSGANATSAMTTYGTQITNTSTGTTSVNVGGSFAASGGASKNWALQTTAGNVQLFGGAAIAPSADSASAIVFTKADGTTVLMTLDTTNARVKAQNAGAISFSAGDTSAAYLSVNSTYPTNRITSGSSWGGNVGVDSGGAALLNITNGAANNALGSLAATNATLSGSLSLSGTITIGGTTGAQTINKSSGSVNFAAAATSLVVTNSLVTTSSVIQCTVATNDTTMKSTQCVAASGSFTVFSNAAATSECRVNFTVFGVN